MTTNPDAALFRLLALTSEKPTQVNQVHVTGIKTTRAEVLEKLLTPTYDSKKFGETLANLTDLCGKLEALGIAKSTSIKLDRDDSSSGIIVHLKIDEVSRLTVQTGTEFGNGEGNMNGSVNLRNIAGGGEHMEASVAYGTKTTSAFQFRASKPVSPLSPNSRLEFSAFQNLVNNQTLSSNDLVSRGIGLNHRATSNIGHHELAYNGVWRTVENLGFGASTSIRDQAGHNVKSSLIHTLTRDNRNDPLLPTEGSLLRFVQEIAGLKGDSKFAKLHLDYQHHSSLTSKFIFSLGLRGGILFPFDSEKPSHIADRFFLGGPTSIRGFGALGLGPKDGNDVLGGDLMVAVGASLLTPLPYFTTPHFKGHLFANAGRLTAFNSNQSIQDQFKALVSQPSSTVGLGLVYRHSVVRLELNYCFPLARHTSDKCHQGLQLGLGIDFL